ncbi:MAG: hypothetical protein ACHQ4H_06650 [Ktedonobacterales bacterium]
MIQHSQRFDAAPATDGAPARAGPLRTWPVVVLTCLFAGLIPETVATSSTSPAKMIAQPISLPFICLFYGTALLLVREALLRRRLGWTGVLLLGIAFGVVNEGVAAGTWYTVLPTGYRFIGPVDLTWIVALTIFHTFLSIVLVAAFVECAFPAFAGRSLLRWPGITICAVLFGGFALLVALTPHYRAYRLLALALACALTLVALLLPGRGTRVRHGPLIASASEAPPRLWTLRLAGFGVMCLYFVLIYLVPAIVASVARGSLLADQFFDIALLLLFSGLLIWRGWRWFEATSGWTARHTLALITGALTFTILMSVLLPEGWALAEPLVTLPFFVLLLWLGWRARQRDRAPAPAVLATAGDELSMPLGGIAPRSGEYT